jgi:hypothetical protein
MNSGTSDLLLYRPATAAGYGNGASQAAVLTSWKEIARYMGKGVRTVQRWEQDFGLPVRRPAGTNKKAVLARPRDLDVWVAMRCHSRPQRTLNARENAPADGQPAQGGSDSRIAMEKLVLLNAQIETARLLRQSNLQLMGEVNTALEQLTAQINSIHSAR